MVEHLVLFAFKAGTTDEQIAALEAGLHALPEQIETIAELSCGRNFSERSQGHDLGLRVLFADREGLAVYQPHPAHQAVVEQLVKPIVAQVTVVDYETA